MTAGAVREGGAGASLDLRVIARAFGHSPSAIAVVTGEEHSVIYANAALRDLVAHGAETLHPGAPLLSAFGDSTSQALIPALEAVRGGRRSWRGVVPIDDEDGDSSDRWPCAVWALGDGAAGELPAIMVEVDASAVSTLARLRFRDLTERVLLTAFREGDRADAADAAVAAARKVIEARRQVIAAMSHDLRTPLQAIGGYARLFEMGLLGPVTDEQQIALLRIQTAMQHVLGLATGLLAHDSVEAGTALFTMEDVQAASMVQDAAALLQMQANAKGIALCIGPCDGTVVTRADPGKLRQILVNLLGNAVKFTPQGGTITATCETDGADPGAHVVICVSDTGRGILEADLARVFEPYVQVGRALSTGDAGVGLGLAISRAFAQGMGGELTVSSVVDEGSRFTLTLPRVAAGA